jgi:hypothetical protein
MYNMPAPFEIKRLNYVLLARSLSIYFGGLMSKWSHGHPFMTDLNGIKRSCLPSWTILIRRCLIQPIDMYAMMPSKRPAVVI